MPSSSPTPADQQSLGGLLQHAAEAGPSRAALWIDGSSVSYAELWRLALGWAAAVDKQVSPGGVVAIAESQPLDCIAAFFGVQQAGRTALMLDARDPEIADVCSRGQAEAVVGEGLVAVGLPQLQPAPVAESARRARSTQGAAEILLTSGSTGRPSLVALGPRGIVSNARAHAASIDLRADDRQLLVMPLFHAFGLNAQLVAGVAQQASLIIGDLTTNAASLASLLQRCSPTVVCGPPTLYRMMARWPRAWRSGLREVRIATVGAAPMVPTDPAVIQELVPDACIYHTYGLTEASPRVATLPAAEFAEHWRSAGYAIHGVRLRLQTPGGVVATELEPGEVEVGGDGVMLGYLGQPDRTSEALSEGWLRTGDLGFLDSVGRLHLVGRRKEVILCGGLTLSPLELERQLLEQPGILEAVVVGLPNAVHGEVPHAVVTAEGALDPVAVRGAMHAALGPSRAPRSIEIWPALPMTASGKVDRASVRSRLVVQAFESSSSQAPQSAPLHGTKEN